MKEVQCQCGKKYKISEKDYISECPFCDCLGLMFDPSEPLLKCEELNDIQGRIVQAIWLNLFDYDDVNFKIYTRY